MKNILSALIIFSFFIQKTFATGTTVLRSTVFCPSSDCGLTTDGIKANLPTGIIKSDSIIDVIFAYLNFFMPFLGVFGFILLVYAGFSYIFKDSGLGGLADDPMKIIKNVVIGFVIVFLSYSIVALMINMKS